MTERVVIVVPAFNEEMYIGKFLSSLMASVRPSPISRLWKFAGRAKAPAPYTVEKVVVVDDGSTDKTQKIAQRKGAEVISLGKNHGKAFAFFKGAEHARNAGATIIVTLDADLKSVSRKQLDLLLEPVVNRKHSMSVGVEINDNPIYSGQRAIRLSSLNPLFRQVRKWEEYFGLTHGNFTTRQGFALETALNILLGRWKLVSTNFRKQRPFGEKKLSSGRKQNYQKAMNLEIERGRQVHLGRLFNARQLRASRKRGMSESARQELLKEIRRRPK